MDAEGRHTTELSEAIEGMVLPISGPKGYGIAVFSGAVGDQLKVFDRPQKVELFLY